jgi:hypothetical protein
MIEEPFHLGTRCQEFSERGINNYVVSVDAIDWKLLVTHASSQSRDKLP